MKTIADVMTRDLVSIGKDATLQDAAAKMAKEDIGSLPVTDGKKLVGVVTDRDIVVRCVAKGAAASAKVSDAMTKDVTTCASSSDVHAAARLMGDKQIRRLYVMDAGELVGVVALGDLATEAPVEDAAKALKKISQD